MKKTRLIEIFKELRDASHSIDHNNPIKYNIFFSGKDYNEIHSFNLFPSLQTVFKLDITKDDLLKLIPEICDSLEMKYFPYISPTSYDTKKIVYYVILLR